MRELPKYSSGISASSGITPACAGITQQDGFFCAFFRDHPRVCGNYRLGFSFMSHVRRITPACAGITYIESIAPDAGWDHPRVCGNYFFLRSTSRSCRDHPRVCGNYCKAFSSAVITSGSPPRVRELLRIDFEETDFSGITPACAGITILTSFLKCLIRDHPRVCGNYVRDVPIFHKHTGSPPRVRELLATAE